MLRSCRRRLLTRRPNHFSLGNTLNFFFFFSFFSISFVHIPVASSLSTEDLGTLIQRPDLRVPSARHPSLRVLVAPTPPRRVPHPSLPIPAQMALTMRRKAGSYIRRRESVLGKQSVTVQVEATCPICQEPIGCKNPEGIVETWSVLPCGHRFGSYCIKHYLRVVATERPSCPVCRQNVYHSCYHPVLPAVLKPSSKGGPQMDEIVEAAQLILPEVQFSECGYCLARKSAEPPVRRGRLAKWTSTISLSWLKVPKMRRSKPERAANSREGDAEAESEEDAGSDEETPDSPPLNGIPTPWIDPFPRPRDHEWEKWWIAKEPRGA